MPARDVEKRKELGNSFIAFRTHTGVIYSKVQPVAVSFRTCPRIVAFSLLLL
jgi:hypothetical protein